MRYLTLLLLCLGISLSQAYAAEDVQEIQTPYGFKAWMIEDRTLPIYSLHLAFKHAGTAYDPEGKEGLAAMAAALLDEGAGDLNATAFKKRLEELAIKLEINTDDDILTIKLKTLKEHSAEALSLLKMLLTSPRFDEDAIERVRQQMLTSIASREESPEYQASKAFSRLFFGKHPYSHDDLGTPESLATITRADLKNYIASHINRMELIVAAVGDLRPATVKEMCDTYLVGLPLTTQNTVDIPDFKEWPKGTTDIIDKPIEQSVVVFGQKGLKRDDPDFYPAFVMNYILGEGGFSSRLMTEVREKRGLAYTVSTGLNTYQHTGIISGYVATKNSKVHESVTLIQQEIAKVQKNGVTEEEVQTAKDYLTGSFALKLDRNEKLADFLLGMQIYDLGKDFLTKRNDYIRAVTRDDVNRVAKSLLTPDALVTVIVGNKAEMDKSVTP